MELILFVLVALVAVLILQRIFGGELLLWILLAAVIIAAYEISTGRY